jgi:hypothetical protein
MVDEKTEGSRLNGTMRCLNLVSLHFLLNQNLICYCFLYHTEQICCNILSSTTSVVMDGNKNNCSTVCKVISDYDFSLQRKIENPLIRAGIVLTEQIRMSTMRTR